LDGYPVPPSGKLAAVRGGGRRPRGRGSTLASIDATAASENEDAPNLADIVGALEADGYRGQMAARPGGRLMCFTCHNLSDVSDVDVEYLRRTEGASDPDDMLAVVALTCPRCGARATVVLGYGPEAAEDDADVLLGLARPDHV
jgi:hypothetical protein